MYINIYTNKPLLTIGLELKHVSFQIPVYTVMQNLRTYNFKNKQDLPVVKIRLEFIYSLQIKHIPSWLLALLICS